jgi:hypothetical protein
MEGFVTSRPARVASVAMALVLMGGGMATHLSGDMALWVASSCAFLGVGAGLVGMGWFADDAFATVLGIVLLPLALMLFMPVTFYVAFFEREHADLLLFGSLAFGVWGLRPARRVRAVAAQRRFRVV